MKLPQAQQPSKPAAARQLPQWLLRGLDTWLLPAVCCVALALLAFYYLWLRNADVLYFLQDRGWWNSTQLFFADAIRLPGGLLSWMGAFLTQFFFYPLLGTTLLVGVWVLSFCLAKWSFRVPGKWSVLLLVPIVALLSSIIQLGFWVYLLSDIDYAFYHSLGLLSTLILSIPFWQYLPCGERCKQTIAFAWIPLVAALGYWPFGIYALMASVIVGVRLLTKSPVSAFCSLAVTLLTIWLIPISLTTGTTLMRPDEPWLCGFKTFFISGHHDMGLEMPFYVVLITPVLLPLLRFLPDIRKRWVNGLLTTAMLAGAICLLESRDYRDYNFHAELRMQRAVEEQRWGDVLKEAALAKEPVTREMVLFRDIALLNTGQINDTRYAYNNISAQPATFSDSIFLRISNRGGDLIYYNFGETNFAIRRATERSMHYGYSHYTLRMLTRCALLGGETDNVRKYLRLLERSTFWRGWAEEIRPFACGDSCLSESERFAMPLRLRKNAPDNIGTDDGYVEQTLLKLWMCVDTNDPIAQQWALNCAMEMRQINVFWAQAHRYYQLNPGKPFPRHVQEAILFYYYELKSPGINISRINFDETVLRRYREFSSLLNKYAASGMNEQQMGDALKPMFGDTYMWDYCANRIQTN